MPRLASAAKLTREISGPGMKAGKALPHGPATSPIPLYGTVPVMQPVGLPTCGMQYAPATVKTKSFITFVVGA